MAIDVEFLLARHPFLFLGWESGVEGFHSGGVLAAIGGGKLGYASTIVDTQDTRELRGILYGLL